MSGPPASGPVPDVDDPVVHERPAPALQEVAAIRWDVDGVPRVRWTDGTAYQLVHPDDDEQSVSLVAFATAPPDPAAVADALAESLAACDFPPTDDHAAPGRVRAALRVARVAHPEPAVPDSSDRG